MRKTAVAQLFTSVYIHTPIYLRVRGQNLGNDGTHSSVVLVQLLFLDGLRVVQQVLQPAEHFLRRLGGCR